MPDDRSGWRRSCAALSVFRSPIKIHLLPPTLPGRQATARAPVVKKDAALGVPVREVGGMDGGGRREGLVTGDLLVVGVILVGSFTGGTSQGS